MAKAFQGLGLVTGTSAERAAHTSMVAGTAWYETDTDKTFVYSGSSWLERMTSSSTLLSSQMPAASVVKVHYAQTSATRYDLTSDEFVAIPGLSITLTPQSSQSKFVLSAQVSNNARYVYSFGFFRNSSNLHSHGSNNNVTGAVMTGYHNLDIDGNIYSVPLVTFDSPSTTSSLTYDVRGTSSWASGTKTLIINDRGSSDMRSLSSLTIMELRS